MLLQFHTTPVTHIFKFYRRDKKTLHFCSFIHRAPMLNTINKMNKNGGFNIAAMIVTLPDRLLKNSYADI